MSTSITDFAVMNGNGIENINGTASWLVRNRLVYIALSRHYFIRLISHGRIYRKYVGVVFRVKEIQRLF